MRQPSTDWLAFNCPKELHHIPFQRAEVEVEAKWVGIFLVPYLQRMLIEA